MNVYTSYRYSTMLSLTNFANEYYKLIFEISQRKINTNFSIPSNDELTKKLVKWFNNNKADIDHSYFEVYNLDKFDNLCDDVLGIVHSYVTKPKENTIQEARKIIINIYIDKLQNQMFQEKQELDFSSFGSWDYDYSTDVITELDKALKEIKNKII